MGRKQRWEEDSRKPKGNERRGKGKAGNELQPLNLKFRLRLGI
jgi:hypothetical protein